MGVSMNYRRLRAGELIVFAGGICMIVSLFEAWYRSPSGNLNAWDTFGPTIVLLMLGAIAAVALVASALTERSTALPVALGVWTVLFGLLAVIAAVIRLLERPDQATSLCTGPWLALAGALAIFAGAWETLRDERPSMYEPASPAPRHPPAA